MPNEEIESSFDNDFKKQYKASMQLLLEHMLKGNPYQMLSMFSLTYLAAMDGITKEHTQPDVLTAMHVELLQGLALRFQISEYKRIPPDSETIKELVQETLLNFTFWGMAQSLAQPKASADVFSMRLHTLAIRNWAYPKETFELVENLFAPFNDDFKTAVGLGSTEVVQLLRSTIQWIEHRAKVALNAIFEVMNSASSDDVCEKYKNNFGKDLSTRKFDNLDDLKNYAMAHWQAVPATSIFLLDAPGFNAIATINKVDAAKFEELLRTLSYCFGDLANTNLDHFFLGNPIWTSPFVKNESTYFLPVPSLLVSNCIEIMEKILPAAKIGAYEDHRYKLLENMVAELFAKRFDCGNVFRGSIYNEAGHENDLLFLLDNHAFVIESKSGAIPPKAKIGLEKTLAKTAKKLIVESSEQALRFAEFILLNRTEHSFRTVKNAVNKVDLTHVEHAVPMGAILSPLTQAYPGWQKLLRSSLVEKQTQLVCCYLVTDLGYIFDVLDSDVALLHYITRREKFEEKFKYEGDEIDVLNFYLDNGFPSSDDYISYLFDYGQPDFNAYFMTRGSTITVQKPCLKRNNTWLRLISQIGSTKTMGWIDLGCALLDIDIQTQDEAHEKLEHLLMSLMNQTALDADCCSIIYPADDSQRFLVLAAYRDGANIATEIDSMLEKIRRNLTATLPVEGILITGTIRNESVILDAKILALKRNV